MSNIEIIIITALVTSLLWLVAWMIEYAERMRVIEIYEKSYVENGIRYVDLPDTFIVGMGVPLSQMTYSKYRLENGEWKLDKPNNPK